MNKIFLICTPWELKKTSGFVLFSGGIERKHKYEEPTSYFFPASIYLLKDNNRNTRARYEIS